MTQSIATRAIVLAISITACSRSADASETRKAEPFIGVTHWQVIQSIDDTKPPKLPRPVVINILEINTKAPGVRFEMSPGNGDELGEIKRGTTRAFVDGVRAQMGVNVGFYDTKANYGNLNTDLMHLAASNGDVYSAAHGGEWVFDVSKTNVPRIAQAGKADSKTVGNNSPVYNAAGGNQPMLHNGAVVAPPEDGYTKALNPHTAVGVSKDQSRVFLVTVDGRQGGYSEGMRTDELARIMAQFGAWDAINFDGGGSTTMVMDDTDDGKADSRLVNSPSDNSSPAKPGNDRVVANSLAVFAAPNPKYVPLPPVPRPTLKDALELIKSPTLIDGFEGEKGHFTNDVTSSNSTKGIDAKSSAAIDTKIAQAGKSSLKLTIVADAAKKDEGMQLRFVSGDATPKTNAIDGKAMGNDGFVGVYLRREPGGPPLYVSMIVDEGTPDVIATERGQPLEVKADGQWHLYQWGLNEDAKWFNYNGGNGTIDGPNVFVDSLLFRTAKDTSEKGVPFSGDVWIDSLTYNPGGRIE